jgi:hypothetical protein
MDTRLPHLKRFPKSEAMEINLADFFPKTDTAQNLQGKATSELSQPEMLLLTEIRKFSATLSKEDKILFLGMVRKMATVPPHDVKLLRSSPRSPEY